MTPTRDICLSFTLRMVKKEKQGNECFPECLPKARQMIALISAKTYVIFLRIKFPHAFFFVCYSSHPINM